MMLKIETTAKFRKDVHRAEKRGQDIALLKSALNMLANGQTLPFRFYDHALTGNYIGSRECHIQPDWLLIYEIDKGKLILTAMRTGTHSDLFDT